jgi:hypothetical protein
MSNALNFLRPTNFGFDVFVNGWHLAKVVESPAAPEYSVIDRQGQRVGASIPSQPHLLPAHINYLLQNDKLPTCNWLVEVATGNPEPDFPEDLYREVECGAPVTFNKYGSWHCECGHEHVSFDDPARDEYDAEWALIERMEDR